MESLDKEYGSAMGALFHQVITDMKVQWRASVARSSKGKLAIERRPCGTARRSSAFKMADARSTPSGTPRARTRTQRGLSVCRWQMGGFYATPSPPYSTLLLPLAHTCAEGGGRREGASGFRAGGRQMRAGKNWSCRPGPGCAHSPLGGAAVAHLNVYTPSFTSGHSFSIPLASFTTTIERAKREECGRLTLRLPISTGRRSAVGGLYLEGVQAAHGVKVS